MIDLRSEIVIQPSEAMRKAMATAAVGADLFREDGTVDLLERQTAELLGKEAAIFLPTVTMGNLIALKLLGRPGDEAIVESRSHIYGCEMAGISALCGMLAHPLDGDETGLLPWDRVRPIIRARGPMRAQTSVLCLEDTHNFAGGTIPDHQAMLRLCDCARSAGLKLHLDGARLFNACVGNGHAPAEMAKPFDSIVVSFSKGLGAPAGAALASDAVFIEEARRVRRMLGGSMNQPGVLAAACLYGLDRNYARLAEDHRRAKSLANALASVAWASLNPSSVRTNIVIFEPVPQASSSEIVSRLRSEGMLVYPLEDGRIRLVTHLDFTDDMLRRAVEIIQTLNVH